MKSSIKNALTTPRKASLIVRALKHSLGKNPSVDILLKSLRFINKKAASILFKVVRSCKANVEFYNSQEKNTEKIPINQLVLDTINIGDGETRKRWMPRARGNSSPILKRTTNIEVILKVKNLELKTGGKDVD